MIGLQDVKEKSVEDKELLGLFHKEHRDAQSSTKVLGDLQLQGLPSGDPEDIS